MKFSKAANQLLSKAANLVGKQVDVLEGQTPPTGSSTGWPKKDDPVLDHLLRNFRSAKLRKQFFSQPVQQYTETVDVKLLVGTYNVAGKKPPSGLKVHEWLNQWKDCWPSASGSHNADGRSSNTAGPDLIIVGFQEVVPLSAGNVIAGPTTEGADAWDFVLASTLNGDQWASKNVGRTFGSSVAGQAMYLNNGSQAAYAYNVISNPAASVVGAMDKVWTGQGSEAALGLASEQQQQQRLARVLAIEEDGEDVYVQVVCRQLVGVYISVWARKRLARHIRGVQATSAATGWGGYLGNKGAVAVRMRVYDAPLVAVCAHLASGDQEGDELKRNYDVAEILRRCSFATDALQQDLTSATQQQQPSATASASSSSSSGQWGRASSILDHDNVVWLGDLNYRLICGDEEARRLIRAGRLEALLSSDQLTREMAAGKVFQGWKEGPVTFNPTYKYHLGCNMYSGEPLPPGAAAIRAVDSSTSLADNDAAPSEMEAVSSSASAPEKQKKRTPAWCDRILWLPQRQLYQLAYGRGELAVSDHRPVAAAFLLEAHWYDRAAVQQLAETARRSGDMLDNAARPRCTLHPNFIEFGLVPFGHQVCLEVQLVNVGSTTARYYFVPPAKPREGQNGMMSWDDDQPISAAWLEVSPTEGEVQEGETISIALTALITGGGPSSAAAYIAANPAPPPAPVDTLDTILILRLEDGADSFISCHGTFLPSCFGMDLDALLRLGSTPVIAVEQLDQTGQQMLQQGLQPPSGLASMQQQQQQQGGVESLRQQIGDLGLPDELRSSATHGGHGTAALAAVSGSRGQAQSEGSTLVTGVEARVPKEIQRLVNFLLAGQRLHTPGLFVDSIQACCGPTKSFSKPTYSSAAHLRQLLVATAPVRWALDTGLDLPSHITAHQATAALLLMLQQLPESLMPPDVSAVLLHCVPPAPACTSLLSDAMSVAEWATLRHIVALCKAALAAEAAAVNGLTSYMLAAVLAEHCFGGPAAVPPELSANRVAFMMMLLDPEAAAQRREVNAAAGDTVPPAAPVHQRGTSAVLQPLTQQPQESLI